MVANIDFETRSGTDIELGLCRYLGDPDATVLCMAWTLDGQTINLWTPSDPNPEPLLHHVAKGGKVRGWNVSFEHAVWNRLCVPTYGWPELRIDQCVDTMAQAAICNLPQSLGKCAQALGLPEDKQKDRRGKYLIQRLCKPHPPTKTRAGRWVNDPNLLRELYEYCKQDVVTEIAVAKVLPEITAAHQENWVLTQRINQRGVPIDADEVRRIVAVVEQEKAALNATLESITGIPAATQRDALLKWVRAHGVDLPDLTSDTLDAVIPTLPEGPVRQALLIRSKVAQTSTAKYDKMLQALCPDGTLKGLLTYHGASTGRYASRGGLNFQNLPRPPLGDPDTCVSVLSEGDWDWARALYGGDVMDAAVSAMRGVIKAPPGYEFIDADFSSVENRVSAWIAGQQDKVADFAAGKDEYKVFACDMYRVAYEEVTKDMRQVAKSAVLGCFGADTYVLTDSGPKRIVDITLHDKVHDGVEFVAHGGVAFQGVKKTIDLIGVRVTPDHLFLEKENKWARADSLDLSSAIGLASGLLSASLATGKKSRLKPAAHAVPRPWFHFMYSETVDQHVVGPVTTTHERVISIVNGGWNVAMRPYEDVQTQRIKRSQGMVAGGSRFIKNGSCLLKRFLTLLKHFLGGTTRVLNLIGLITIRGMNRVMSGLQPDLSKIATGRIAIGFNILATYIRGPNSGVCFVPATDHKVLFSESCGKVSLRSALLPSKSTHEVPTYDILNAGPRNRFVVLTDCGPLIAHNCMFGQGWKGLIDYATTYGVKLDEARSRNLVSLYRNMYSKVQALWYRCGDKALAAVQNPGLAQRINDKLMIVFRDGFLKLRLPSRRVLYWYDPKIEMTDTPWGEQRPGITVMGINQATRKWQRQKLIGSSIFQSAVQGTALDLLINGVKNVESAGYSVVLLVHDEILSLVPEGFGSEDEFGRLMCTVPSWASDLPLAFEAWRGDRFRK